jgi:hypothetical protein
VEIMRMHFIPPAAVALAALVSTVAAAQVRATITADNRYMVGYGPANGPATWQAVIHNVNDASEIFSCGTGPEVYTLNPGVGDYLYIAANSDKEGTQGVIARLALTGGAVVVSGSPGWQVLATGNDVPLSAAAADAALAAPPVAWASPVAGPAVGLAFGEYNAPVSAQNPLPDNFQLVCNNAANLIPVNARWMWYRSVQGTNAFRGTLTPGGHREFLIFRIPMSALMCACPRVNPRDATDAKSEGVTRGLDIRVRP